MSEERRNKIIEALKESSAAVSAASLARKFGVSRQVIVGDIALLRAAGENISATPRGYTYDHEGVAPRFGYVGIVACRHEFAQLREELYTAVDFGGTVIDVMIEHSLYGQLSGILDLSSRRDVDIFMEKIQGNHDKPLYALTGGIHLHRIGCRDKETFLLIEKSLKEKNILYTE